MAGIYGNSLEDRHFEALLMDYLGDDDDDAIREEIEEKIAKLRQEIEDCTILPECLEDYTSEEIAANKVKLKGLRDEIEELECELGNL